jgi:hypothetical protein
MLNVTLPLIRRRMAGLILALGLIACAGCATQPPLIAPAKPLQVTVPKVLREGCARPILPNEADLAMLGSMTPEERERMFWAPRDLVQETAVTLCEARGDAAVALLDAFNAAAVQAAPPVKRKRWGWWKF